MQSMAWWHGTINMRWDLKSWIQIYSGQCESIDAAWLFYRVTSLLCGSVGSPYWLSISWSLCWLSAPREVKNSRWPAHSLPLSSTIPHNNIKLPHSSRCQSTLLTQAVPYGAARGGSFPFRLDKHFLSVNTGQPGGHRNFPGGHTHPRIHKT